MYIINFVINRVDQRITANIFKFLQNIKFNRKIEQIKV